MLPDDQYRNSYRLRLHKQVLEQVAPYWPAAAGIAAVVAIVAAVSRVMLVARRYMKGRTVSRRTALVTDIVTPLLDERFQVVDAAILNLRLELGETKQVVDEVKAIVSNGLTDDVAYLRNRVDGIYNHLIPDPD